MSNVRIAPSVAALVASAISGAASECRSDEHVVLENLSGGNISIGVSDGYIVRNESAISLFHDRPGGYIR